MKRTDLLDTSLEAHGHRVRLLREKGPEWRFRQAVELAMASEKMFPEGTRRYFDRLKRDEHHA